MLDFWYNNIDKINDRLLSNNINNKCKLCFSRKIKKHSLLDVLFIKK